MNQRIFYVLAALLTVSALSCSKVQQDATENKGKRIVELNASIGENPALRANVNDAGAFTWSSGDEIGVWTSDAKFTKFSLKSGESGKNSAIFTAELEEGVSVVGPAVYPYRTGHSYDQSSGILTYNQPPTMDWTSNTATKPHMAAKIDGSGHFLFKHLDGLFRFSLHNVPLYDDCVYIRLRSSDNVIYGNFTVNMNDENPQITATALGSGNSDFNMKIVPDGSKGNIYDISFPVPVGTYATTRISAQKKDWTMISSKTTASSNVITRGKMIRMPEFTLNNIMLDDMEHDGLRANFNLENAGDPYANPGNTEYTIQANASLEVMDASAKNLKLDASSQGSHDGYFVIKTQNSDYTTDFRSGAKAFRMKIRFNNSADAAMYVPYVALKGKFDDFKAPDKINGVSCADLDASFWSSNIKADGWNVLQWTYDCSGVWKIQVKALTDINGNETTGGSGILYIDDLEFIK